MLYEVITDQTRVSRPVLQNLPLSFERNQGQTDAQVKFLARGNGYAVFLTSYNFV